MRTVVVDNVLWSGPRGGAVFSGLTDDEKRLRIVAAADVMPRPPVSGEVWDIDGPVWKHPVHGKQVRVRKALLKRPSGRLIMRTIARSSLFAGIGERKARHLWEAFGEDLYACLAEGDPSPFAEVIGEQLADVLVMGWRELAVEADVFEWLDRRGVPVWLANKLIAIYGEDVVNRLEENPYLLLAFTSWNVADTLARSIGIKADDDRRLVGAADAVVGRRLQDAHTWADPEEFVKKLKETLWSSMDTAYMAQDLAIAESAIIEIGGGVQGLGPASMEQYIATRIHDITAGRYEAEQLSIRVPPDQEFLQKFYGQFRWRERFPLNAEQEQAVEMALTSPVGLIGGGAGTGKTTVLKAIIQAAERLGTHVHMMALSGRAARRMTEATGRTAMTIASFLIAIDKGSIDLGGDPIIAVDESSMLDLPTMYRLLSRFEPGCRLLLLGDPGQLPPIGFGIVFHALVEYGGMPKVELTEIVRQAEETGIPQVSRGIREGRVPELHKYAGRGVGVSFVECDPNMMTDIVLEVVADLGGFDAAQIISALKIGVAGTTTINQVCHSLHATGRQSAKGFAVGEPVIWLANNYELDLMNGSLGVVRRIENGCPVVNWDGTERAMDTVADMDLAYAITVHKSQGSQWERVVVPVFGSRLLDRTLVYTAITRAEKQVVLVGDRQAFERAVTEPPSSSRRETGMKWWLGESLAHR